MIHNIRKFVDSVDVGYGPTPSRWWASAAPVRWRELRVRPSYLAVPISEDEYSFKRIGLDECCVVIRNQKL